MIQTVILQASGFDMSTMVMLGAFLIVFYFFIMRPQIVRQKKEKKFQEEIKRGAKVVMTSGIHGKISEINENNNTVVIETGAGKIRFERSAISMELTNNLNKNKKDSKS